MSRQTIFDVGIIFKARFLFQLSLAFLILSVTAHTVYATNGPGLYKDGKKVIGFDFGFPGEADAPAGINIATEDDDKKRNIVPKSEVPAHSFDAQKNCINIILRCQELVNSIADKLAKGESIDEDLNLLRQQKDSLDEANRVVLEKFDQIERDCVEKGYPQKILDRHTQMVQQHRKAVGELLQHLESLDTPSNKKQVLGNVQKLHEFLASRKFKEDPPFLHSQPLPVNMTKIEAPVIVRETGNRIRSVDFNSTPTEAGIKTESSIEVESGGPTAAVNADQSKNFGELIMAAAAPPTQADLDPTIDVQFTTDVTDLANSLDNSPLEIYEYVKNNFEFEPYLGSRKGSQETLVHRSGNDYDLASLMIALLRVSGIPARYATGIIEMSVDAANSWLGVEDGATAGSILTTAGMEGVSIVDGGGDVVAVRCRRVWVEAHIPYTNYRGIDNDGTGKMWIPMDPAFAQYDYQAALDIPKEMGFDAEVFVNDYIASVNVPTLVELFKQDVTDYLAVNHPTLAYEDILRTRTLRKDGIGFIPGSFPYKVLSRDDEFSVIAANKRYQIRFHIHGGGTNLDYTANLPEIAGKQVTISYIGETPADQQIIDDAGGVYGVAQPWLVSLKPVLKIDGCAVATGSGGVIMGTVHDSDMFFTPPTGVSNEVPSVLNTIIAGTYQAIGINTWNIITNFFAPATTTCEESYTGALLYDTAMKYLGRVNVADDEVAQAMHMVITNDVAEAIVEHAVKVLYNGFGTPISFEWAGLIVDADRKIVGPFSVTGDDENCNFMRLAGADGSLSENRIFEDEFDEPAVSTIRILELASDQGIPIFDIDSTNIASILPILTVSSTVKSAISSAVASGHEVKIPRDDITYFDWSGTGYIDLDPDGCAAGYIIAGGINGGATVKEWTIDLSGLKCINATINSISPAANGDLYCSTDTNHLVFDVTIEPYDEDCNAQASYQRSFSTADPPNPLTIKDIADAFGPGEYTFTVGSIGGCPGCGIDQKKFTIFKVELVTPKKSPVTDPKDSGDGQNEFTFSDASPGVLTVNFKAKVEPSSADLSKVKDLVKFTIENVGQAPTWDATNPGGKSSVSGSHLVAIAKFSGLPANNSDFGTKKVTIECDGQQVEQTDIEVFFPRDKSNNPGGSDPNWFYYWKEVYGNNNVVFQNVAGSASTPGLLNWSYTSAPNKTQIDIKNSHPGKFKGYGVGELFSGIDRFVGSVVHEEKHVDQIARADMEITITPNTSWQYGWSFNQGANHNHWTVGADGKPGDAGTDDDTDGTVDNHITSGPGELGSGDDVDLTHPTSVSRNWPKSWPLPSPKLIASEIEHEAIKHSDDNVDEDDYADQDWGDPGKQHKTLNKWDD